MKGITCPACKQTITELKEDACPNCNYQFAAYEANAIEEVFSKKTKQ